jgi:hypothetical protein
LVGTNLQAGLFPIKLTGINGILVVLTTNLEAVLWQPLILAVTLMVSEFVIALGVTEILFVVELPVQLFGNVHI